MAELIVLVTGTGTAIGKTWVVARLAQHLRASGARVVARKPVMSFAPEDVETDASVLAGATGEDEHTICRPHRRYERALAPPMAADALGRPPIRISDLVAEVDLPQDAIVLIEGAGGVRSPIAHDGDALTLADELRPDLILLVAPSALGALNDILTALDAIAGRRPVLLFSNRFDAHDDVFRRNLEWLRGTGLDPITDVDDLARRVLEAHANNLGAFSRPLEVT